MERTKKLIIVADDFGLSAGVNRGIMETHRAGLVKSASLIVNLPGFDDAVRACSSAPALETGLHLNLTCGLPSAPAAKVPSLLGPDGGFLSLPALLRRLVTGSMPAAELREEISAQLKEMKDSGLKISYIDSHRHVHMVPRLFRICMELAAENGIGAIRLHDERLSGIFRWRGQAVKRFGLKFLSRWMTGECRRASLKAAPNVLGTRLFDEKLREANPYVDYVSGVLPGFNLMICHPARVDGDLEALDAYTAPREIELKCLLDPRFREALDRAGVVLSTHGEMSGS